MTEENFRYMEHIFLSTLFLVIFINLDLKQHGDIIQLDFKGQIGWFFTLGNFFFQKSWGKTEKMKKRPKSTKNDQKWNFLDSRHGLLLILSDKSVKTSKNVIFHPFRTFFGIWSVPLSRLNPLCRDTKKSTFFASTH